MIISSQRCIVRGVGHPWITALCYHRQYSQQIPSQGGPPKTPSTDTPGPPPSTWRKAVNTIKSFGQGHCPIYKICIIRYVTKGCACTCMWVCKAIEVLIL